MVVIPTRRPLHGRIKARLSCVLLRWLIRHAEADMRHHKTELEHAMTHLPKQLDHDKAHIDALTRRLQRALNDI